MTIRILLSTPSGCQGFLKGNFLQVDVKGAGPSLPGVNTQESGRLRHLVSRVRGRTTPVGTMTSLSMHFARRSFTKRRMKNGCRARCGFCRYRYHKVLPLRVLCAGARSDTGRTCEVISYKRRHPNLPRFSPIPETWSTWARWARWLNHPVHLAQVSGIKGKREQLGTRAPVSTSGAHHRSA